MVLMDRLSHGVGSVPVVGRSIFFHPLISDSSPPLHLAIHLLLDTLPAMR